MNMLYNHKTKHFTHCPNSPKIVCPKYPVTKKCTWGIWTSSTKTTDSQHGFKHYYLTSNVDRSTCYNKSNIKLFSPDANNKRQNKTWYITVSMFLQLM